MEKKFSWKVFVQYALDNFDYNTFEEFVTELHDSVEWVEECDGRTMRDITNSTPFAVFDDWFE